MRSGKMGGMRKGCGRDGESIKREGIEGGSEDESDGRMDGEGRGCTEGKRTMKELEGGVSEEDEGVGRDENGKRVDRRDGFGDDCFR